MLYIVCRDKELLGLAEANILGYTSPATLFVTYETARQAIRRTQRYADRHGYERDGRLGSHRIMRVRVEE